MAMYEPGRYKFAIAFIDPDGKLPTHVVVSNVQVNSRRSDRDIAQDILNDAKKNTNQPVLRLPKPEYKIRLERI